MDANEFLNSCRDIKWSKVLLVLAILVSAYILGIKSDTYAATYTYTKSNLWAGNPMAPSAAGMPTTAVTGFNQSQGFSRVLPSSASVSQTPNTEYSVTVTYTVPDDGCTWYITGQCWVDIGYMNDADAGPIQRAFNFTNTVTTSGSFSGYSSKTAADAANAAKDNTTYYGQSAAYWAYWAYYHAYYANSNASTAASNASSANSAANIAASNASSAASSASTAATQATNANTILTSGYTTAGNSLKAIYDKAGVNTGPTSSDIATAVGNNATIQNIKTNTENTYAAANEARNALRKKAIKVIKNVSFTEVVYDELNNYTSNGVTATPSVAGLGYTVLTGTIAGSGIQIATFTSKTDGQNRGIIFNVIEAPSLDTIATVNFME